MAHLSLLVSERERNRSTSVDEGHPWNRATLMASLVSGHVDGIPGIGPRRELKSQRYHPEIHQKIPFLPSLSQPHFKD